MMLMLSTHGRIFNPAVLTPDQELAKAREISPCGRNDVQLGMTFNLK